MTSETILDARLDVHTCVEQARDALVLVAAALESALQDAYASDDPRAAGAVALAKATAAADTLKTVLALSVHDLRGEPWSVIL